MSFRLKTILGIASIELVVMLVLILMNQLNLGGSATAQLFGRAQATGRIFSNLISDAVISLDLATLDATIASAVDSEALTYLRIRNPDGIVLSQGGSEEVLARPFIVDNSYESALDDHVIDLSTPVTVAGQVYGAVEIGMTTLAVEQEIASALRWNLAVAALGMTMVAIFGYILGSVLTRQLSFLRRGALAVSDGDLAHQIPVIGRDELAQTARCFNTMAVKLLDEQTQLRARQEELLGKKARVDAIVECMRDIVAGELETDVPDLDDTDEIGDMARATRVFRDAMIAVERSRLQQQRLISAIDQLDEQVAIFGLDGRVLFANSAFRMFHAEILDQLDARFHYSEFITAAKDAGYIDADQDFSAFWQDKDATMPGDTTGPVEINWAPNRALLAVQSHVPNVGTVLSASDITELRLSQAQLAQASKLATLGEMATGIAHELNQPLGVIRMASSNCIKRIEKGRADDEWLTAKLTRIEEQTARAAQIITHMRIFGRTPTGEADAFDLRDAISETTALMRAQANTRGIKLLADIPDEAMPARCERVRLEQVLLNLLGNACDAIESQERTDGAVTISTQTVAGGGYKIFVEDNGGGIPAEVREKIFNPFFTTKPPGKGTGLGLSISFGIIRDMGGGIDVQNTDKGACFEIRLPNANAVSQEQDEALSA